MSDRLEEIKAVYADFVPMPESVVWLIAEVERLREESRAWEIQAKMNDRPEYWEQLRESNERMDAAITAGVLEVSDAKSIFERAALRGALQALVGAVQVVEQSYLDEDCEYVAGYTMESLAAARAVAVAVLTGQEMARQLIEDGKV